MRAIIIDGKVKIDPDARPITPGDRDAVQVARVIQLLKEASNNESKVMGGLDAVFKAIQRAEYPGEASQMDDIKRNAKSIFTWLKKEIDWLQ